jgi:HK97 family phage major capsid protein
MTIKEKRAAALASAKALVEAAKAGQRDLTADEQAEIKGYTDEISRLDAQIKAAQESDGVIQGIAALAADGEKDGQDGDARDRGFERKQLSLGEHFVKHAAGRMKEIKGMSGASAAAPEFKAATDTQVTTGSALTPVLTQIDRTVIQGNRIRLTIADLLGAGTLSGNAISYFVEGALEGAFTTVAETAAKPQLHVADPTTVTDTLKKIAGFIKLSDEMIEDLDFLVSEINTRLLYELARFEEAQLLTGNGTGSNILGLLNRSGIQTEVRGSTAAGDNAQDTLFRAITKVQTGSGLDADGLVINPLDYQALRLSKDANGQYFGGGFFTGPYGNGAIMENPPVWGLRTVVTPAIAQGTALVGSFAQAATVYRKGGVRVESTNSHASDFTSNLVTVRAEERVAMAVRRPSGLVKVTLTPVA